MKRFNLARLEEAQLEAGLDLIASFPIETSEGPLDRAALRQAICAGRKLKTSVFPSTQQFEMLDSEHAICIETWPVKDSAHQLNRWTRLVRRESGWLIESIFEGFTEG
jgi:hypothetical protein